jgi:hypothetical protein
VDVRKREINEDGRSQMQIRTSGKKYEELSFLSSHSSSSRRRLDIRHSAPTPFVAGPNTFSQTRKFVHTVLMKSSKCRTNMIKVDQDSSVGIATRYGLDGPAIEPRGEIFRTRLYRSLGPTRPPVQWVPGLLPGGKTTGAWR